MYRTISISRGCSFLVSIIVVRAARFLLPLQSQYRFLRNHRTNVEGCKFGTGHEDWFKFTALGRGTSDRT